MLNGLSASRAIGQEPGLDHTMHRMPIPGGFVVTPDLVQLIVSQPESAELIYFDTLTEKETQRVELEFKPGVMALRDNSLFVAGKGSSSVYELDLITGKVRKEFAVPGDGISHIAVHPKRPVLFASTAAFDVYSIDMSSKKAKKTKATGDHVAISSDGQFLFTGMQPRSSNGVLLITETPDGSIHFIYDRWGIRSALAKYKIQGSDLSLASSQANASVNGYLMHLSPDGKRLLMTGGGGWRPPAEGGNGGGYVTAIYNTANLSSKLGEAPHAEAVAYHPLLNFAAAAGLGHNLVLFDAKSYKARETIVFSKGGHGGRDLLAFVGKGTKVALYNGANPDAPTEGLHFFSIDLSDEERAQLTKAYGKLSDPISDGAEPVQASKKSNAERPKAVTSTGSTGKSAPAAKRSGPAGKNKVVEAKAGFNDAEGINANVKKNSPYGLGVAGLQPGAGEPGWDSPWVFKDNVSFQKEFVEEGDGAMFLRGTVNAARKLAVPFKGSVRVEQSIRIPPDGDLKVYVNQASNVTAAMWFAGEGKFLVLDGGEAGQQQKIDTQIECKPDQWYKGAVDVDFKSRSWSFSVDGRKFEHAPLHFRGRADYIQEIGLLSEKQNGAYVDALVVSLPED